LYLINLEALNKGEKGKNNANRIHCIYAVTINFKCLESGSCKLMQ